MSAVNKKASRSIGESSMRRKKAMCSRRWTGTIVACSLIFGIAIYIMNVWGSLNSLKIYMSETRLHFLVPGSSDAFFNGTLAPHDHYVVPNIAHFIWFTCHEFNFINLLSVISVYKIMKPDTIRFHTNCEPTGKWWEEAKIIPTLHITVRDPPKAVFGKTLNPDFPEHWSDVARMEILLNSGGVYFDTDIFVVASLEPLRKYDYVVGRPTGYVLNNGIILSSPNSTFLNMFYQSYRNYIPYCYACSSVFMQHDVGRKYKQYIHTELNSMVKPSYQNWRTLFFDKFIWKEGHFTFHIWMRTFRSEYPDVEFTPDYIKHLDSSFGEMCRFIYYGNSSIIDGESKNKPWWTDIKDRT
ncbi:uncharacterized protein LOC144452492 [Glandiceps talaboti]